MIFSQGCVLHVWHRLFPDLPLKILSYGLSHQLIPKQSPEKVLCLQAQATDENSSQEQALLFFLCWIELSNLMSNRSRSQAKDLPSLVLSHNFLLGPSKWLATLRCLSTLLEQNSLFNFLYDYLILASL